MRDRTDADLVAAATAGDVHAFAALSWRYRDRYSRFAVRMVGSRDDAEDVMQSAFIRAYRALEDCRDPARFGAWLYQIVAKVPPGGDEFEQTGVQQSQVFDRGVSNRTTEQVRAIREGCPGLAGVLNPAGNPVNPAGLDDPRCKARR